MVTVVGKVNFMLIIENSVMGVLMEQRHTDRRKNEGRHTERENMLNSVFFLVYV